jgi:hypothetical protein
VTAAITATPARDVATLANDLDANGMNCQTARQSPPDAPQTPLYCVRRWTGKGWRAASKPLPHSEAVALAVRLKAGGVSAFHLRIEGHKGHT